MWRRNVGRTLLSAAFALGFVSPERNININSDGQECPSHNKSVIF